MSVVFDVLRKKINASGYGSFVSDAMLLDIEKEILNEQTKLKQKEKPMADWRVAKSLLKLRDQVNALAPNRDKSNDGTIGDAAHAATHSEHNPDSHGVVRAMDITNDPVHGFPSQKIAEALVASRDPRILYVISNRKIISSQVHPWEWRDYNGSNPHDHHVHISVVSSPDLYDSTTEWDLSALSGVHSPIDSVNSRYHSLVPGGFFSSDPYDHSVPTSIRTNNPGAINGASWEVSMPGYVTTDETSKGNKTTIFETPEQGVATYWELLRRYRTAGATTVESIIKRYGGGQDYSDYVNYVVKRTGLSGSYEIELTGLDDDGLLKFAKAMFRYEAGKETPLSDEQIMYGFNLGRGTSTVSTKEPTMADQALDYIKLQQILNQLKAQQTTVTPVTATIAPKVQPVSITPPPAVVDYSPLSFIDKLFGGHSFTGGKTILGILGMLGTGVPLVVGAISDPATVTAMTTIFSLFTGFAGLGLVAKLDRGLKIMNQVSSLLHKYLPEEVPAKKA